MTIADLKHILLSLRNLTAENEIVEFKGNPSVMSIF